MNRYKHALIVFESEVDDVAFRLGECQNYSEKISYQELAKAGVNVENGHLNMFQLITILKKRKDLIVSFYCVKEKGYFFFYSDFFNLEGAFDDTLSFFSDLKRLIVMCEIKEETINISFTRLGTVLFELDVNIKENGCEQEDDWKSTYEEFRLKINEAPSADAISDAIKFITLNAHKSDNQMHAYLEKNAQFKEEYII